jgi:hypothetical protein
VGVVGTVDVLRLIIIFVVGGELHSIVGFQRITSITLEKENNKYILTHLFVSLYKRKWLDTNRIFPPLAIWWKPIESKSWIHEF